MTSPHCDENIENDCAIVVSSCDAYSDAWEAFFTLFFRYWPDYPFPLYLLSDTKKYHDERIITLNSQYPDWGRTLKSTLNQLPFKYILYLQEDYFLKRKIDTLLIKKLIKIIETEKAAYLRLYPSPGPTNHYKKYKDIGIIEQGAPYRTSLQAAIWDKKYLLTLLDTTSESGADFEKRTPLLSNKTSQPFLSVSRGLFFPYDKSAAIDYLSTGIIKRKWNRSAIKFLKKEEIVVHFNNRDIEPFHNYLQHFLTSLPVIGTFFKVIYRLFYGIKFYYYREK